MNSSVRSRFLDNLGITGQVLEIRAAVTRDDAAKQPQLYDLTLYGTSPGN